MAVHSDGLETVTERDVVVACISIVYRGGALRAVLSASTIYYLHSLRLPLCPMGLVPQLPSFCSFFPFAHQSACSHVVKDKLDMLGEQRRICEDSLTLESLRLSWGIFVPFALSGFPIFA